MPNGGSKISSACGIWDGLLASPAQSALEQPRLKLPRTHVNQESRPCDTNFKRRLIFAAFISAGPQPGMHRNWPGRPAQRSNDVQDMSFCHSEVYKKCRIETGHAFGLIDDV